MTMSVVVLPAAAGLLVFMVPSDGVRRGILVAAAAAHAAVVASWWLDRPGPMFSGWLAVDAMGLLILTIASGLFLAAAVYAVGYLQREGHGPRSDLFEWGRFFRNEPDAVFVGGLLFFLAAMSLVTVAHHFGLLWVAIEATTLTSAPLIYFHRHQRSLEATWKYLLIGSVGIAVALLGTFFLVASASLDGLRVPALVDEFVRHGGDLDQTWLKAAFVAILVGYGTKVGLAPLHSWLPDAHSEAPSVVSALLSGALLNTAFLGILRLLQVMVAAGLGTYASDLLLLFGLLSMFVATAFIVAQLDYKRMLAYSSVEHMGIVAVGVGLGGLASSGAMLHAMNHSVAKALLFLVAGNILTLYRTKNVADVSGVARVLPVSGALWLIGFLAITGTPPFGAFLTEFTILRGAVDGGHGFVATLYLLLLGAIFVAMATVFVRMSRGPAPVMRARESLLEIAPPAALGVVALLLGVYVPPGLSAVAHEAARAIGGA